MTEVLIVPVAASSPCREYVYSNSVDSGRVRNESFPRHRNKAPTLVLRILHSIFPSFIDFAIGFFIPFVAFYDSYHILRLPKVRFNLKYYETSNEISTNYGSISRIHQFETSEPLSNEGLFDDDIPSEYRDEVLLPTNNEINQPTISNSNIEIDQPTISNSNDEIIQPTISNSNIEIDQPTVSKTINKIDPFDPFSSKTSATVERSSVPGLVNLGNTCFMNSILQCLSHTLLLREFYVSGEYKQYLNNKGQLSSPFKRVMIKLWADNVANSVSPKELKRQVGTLAPMFSGYNQHDAHEFMRFLLNELHEEINRASVEGRKSPADNETLGEACARHLTWEDSRISELFGGMLRSEVCCSVCSDKSIVYIPFLDLALPIPDIPNLSFGCYDITLSLSDCLAFLRKEETLDEEERPYCNKCMDLTKSTKQLFVSSFPRYLVIQLKRFSYYPTRTKLTTPVKFTETWRLKDSSNKTHTYFLYGISCHSGGLHGGHYVAYCCYKGIWRCFNDSMVSTVSWDYVRRQEAYILFYTDCLDIHSESRIHQFETSKPLSNEGLFDDDIPSEYKDEVLLPTNNESINEINQPTISLSNDEIIQLTVFKTINNIDLFDPFPSKASATVERSSVPGLVNLGNTCFMNSILQCLSHTLLLREFYVSGEYKQYLNNNGQLSSLFKRVMIKLWDDNVANSVSPKELKRQVGTLAPMFSGYNQHDAHEFMRFLLNELHEEINRASVEGRKSPADNETLGEACARHLTWEDSRISELFGGMLRSEVCCSVCSDKSIVYIPFLDLALPIPDIPNLSFGCFDITLSLSDCLAFLRKEETLDEEERPYCNKCMDLTKSTKQLFVSSFPRYLVIQLKRFSYYPTRTKLTTPVKFTETWRLKDSSDKTHTYFLYGISCHSGGLHGGHYVAYCCYKGIWRCFNDSMVSTVSWDHVRRQEAYILFYTDYLDIHSESN